MTEYDFCIPPFQPPNGTAQGANSSNEKKAKVYEQLKTLRILFKRLRLIYEKCNENCQGMEYTHIEVFVGAYCETVVRNAGNEPLCAHVRVFRWRDVGLMGTVRIIIL